MGYENVNGAFEQWPQLSDRAFRVLVYMAKETRDRDEPPIYWGGWTKLATEALGKRLPVRDGETDGEFERRLMRAVKSQTEIVRRAVAELVEVGAIRSESRGRTGNNARYALAVNPDNCPNSSWGEGPHDPWGERPNNSWGNSSNDSTGPKEKKKEQQKNNRDSTVGRRSIASTDGPESSTALRGW